MVTNIVLQQYFVSWCLSSQFVHWKKYVFLTPINIQQKRQQHEHHHLVPFTKNGKNVHQNSVNPAVVVESYIAQKFHPANQVLAKVLVFVNRDTSEQFNKDRAFKRRNAVAKKHTKFGLSAELPVRMFAVNQIAFVHIYARMKADVCVNPDTFAMLPEANAFLGVSALVQNTKSSAIRPIGAVKIIRRAAICHLFAIRRVWLVVAVYVLRVTSAKVSVVNAFQLRAAITVAQQTNIGRRVHDPLVNQIVVIEHQFVQKLHFFVDKEKELVFATAV